MCCFLNQCMKNDLDTPKSKEEQQQNVNSTSEVEYHHTIHKSEFNDKFVNNKLIWNCNFLIMLMSCYFVFGVKYDCATPIN